MDVRLVQPLNAELPIVVTLSGREMDVRLVQSLNAEAPIPVTPFVIFTVFIEAQLSYQGAGDDVA